MRARRLLPVLLLVMPGVGLVAAGTGMPAVAAGPAVFEGPVPEASCGPGSSPETGIQGEVPHADRMSGRSQKGYRCNLELIGQYQGQGTTWVSQSYRHCAYHSQAFPSAVTSAAPGVHVVDVRNPAKPVLAQRLTSPAFLGNTWESLKVNEERGLLAGVQVGPVLGAAFFDVYDIKTDCLHPRLLNSVGTDQLSVPSNLLGHEGNWSPDGKTYWSTSLIGGQITAIDVSNPQLPRIIYTNGTGATNHGFSLSKDGNSLYLALTSPNGLGIYDVSEIQNRAVNPQMHMLGAVFWTDGATGQHSIPLTYDGHPYVLFVDELSSGGARIIDIGDETKPRVVSKLKLAIQMPSASAQRAKSAGDGTFGYDSHYCDVDRLADPTAVACGYFESGVRVFDIRDPMKPREIAYYNPPAQVGKGDLLLGSEHANGQVANETDDLSADWCSSPPRFVQPNQLWVTCQDNGFMVLGFTNGAYPQKVSAPAAAPAAPAAAPPAQTPRSAPGSRTGSALAATGGAVALPILGLVMVLLGAAVLRRRSAADRT